MAFLSLGLNIEEPQSLEESQKSPKELSDGILPTNGPAAVSKEAQEGTPVSSNQIPQNGTNGAAHKAEPDPVEPEKDNWPEMGMQIIQSVLREAQNKEGGTSSERSSEELSGLPSIEELRKKILEGVIPDFRVVPKNGQPRNGSSVDASSERDSAKQLPFQSDAEKTLGESSTPLSPDFLSSVMDDLRKHVGEDVLAPLNSRIDAEVERAPSWMSAPVPAPEAPAKATPDAIPP